MEQNSVYNQSYCYGCLCKIIVKPSTFYNITSNGLIEILQVKQVPLCTHCTHRAHQTEYFIQNVQENQTLLENSFNIADSTIKEAKTKYNPLFNCAVSNLNSIDVFNDDKTTFNYTVEKIEYESCDTEKDGISYNTAKDGINMTKAGFSEDTTADENTDITDTKINIKIECETGDFGELIDNDGHQNDFDDDNEIKGVIKRELSDEEDEYPLKELKELKLKRTKKSQVSKRWQEPRLSEFADIKIKKITISEKQCLKELEEAKNEEKYLNKEFKCTTCVKGFTFKLSYERHMEKHSKKSGSFECDICKQRYQSYAKVLDHKKYHFERYKCPKCDFVRIVKQSVREHYSVQHSNEKRQYLCHLCNKTFKAHVYLRKHLLTHDAKKFKCTFCNKILKQKGCLNSHLMRMHPDKVQPVKKKPCPFVCKDCGDAFENPSKLKLHSVKHSSVKNFYCVECDKRFKTEISLKTHLTTAQPHIAHIELPFACSQCDKKFATKRSYLYHVDRHNSQRKPLQCDKCDKTYFSPWNLRTHYRLAHEGYKRPMAFPCTMCDKIFDRQSILKGHIRTHTGERPYQCSKCPSNFTQSGSLHTHMKLVHLKLTRDGKPKSSVKI